MGVIIPFSEGQATFKWLCTGITDEAVVTVGYSPPTSDDITEQAAAMNSAMIASGLVTAANMCTGWTYIGVDVTQMTASGPIIATQPASVAGSAASTPLPSNCAFLIKKNTLLGGRRGRGRWYLPPFASGENLVDQAGVVNSGAISAIQGRINAFQAALVTAGYITVVHHSDGAAGTAIQSWQVQSVIGTQRRRMR